MKEKAKVFKIISGGNIDSRDRKFLDNSGFSEEMMKTQWEKSETIPEDRKNSVDMDSLWKSIEKNSYQSRLIHLQVNSILKYAAIFLFGVFSFMTGRYISGEREVNNNFYLAENPPGTISEMRLPDNSRVWLNAGSSIKYNDEFGHSHRNLELEGEAIFNVRKNEEMPFNVNVDGITVTALGTEFYVSAYSFHKSIAAGLLEGSIKLTSPESSFILNMPESVIIDPENGALQDRGPLNPSYHEWRNGKLVFENTRLSEICHRLSNWYNHPVNLEKDLENQKFTLTIKDENLEEVLELIKLASDLKYNHTEDGFYIYSSGK